MPSRDAAEREQEGRAQEETRTGVSGEVAEVEAVIETGARTEDYGERVEPPQDSGGSPVPGVVPAPVRPETAPAEPEPPAPSRADVGRPEDGAGYRDTGAAR